MNNHLQHIKDIVNNSSVLSDDEKNNILKAVKSVSTELEIIEFKLGRTEKVKRTTGILLEETIEELEQKRKAVEVQAALIRAENERKTKELEEARQLQLAMLPKNIPNLPELDIAVFMQTATEVGGDYYDFSTKEDGSLNICLGDATGHGMKAGIMVSSMKSIFTTNALKMSIADFFITANSGIKSMNLKRMMMGFVMLNIRNQQFHLINAGMPPIFLFHNKTKTVKEIKEHGMPIGAMSQSSYSITDATLEKGDMLLLMSDGMPELQNEHNEMFGYDRLKSLFKKNAEKQAQEMIAVLKDEGSNWVNGEAPDDDVTFVVIKMK